MENTPFRRPGPKSKLSWICPVGCFRQGRLRTTSILVKAFWNFKLKVLKYSRSLKSKNHLNHLIMYLHCNSTRFHMSAHAGDKRNVSLVHAAFTSVILVDDGQQIVAKNYLATSSHTSSLDTFQDLCWTWKHVCLDTVQDVSSGNKHSLIAAYNSRHGEKCFPSYVFIIKKISSNCSM